MKRRIQKPGTPAHAHWLDRHGGFTLILVSLSLRTFMAAVVHSSPLGNSFWLALLLGMILGCLPSILHLLIRRLGGTVQQGGFLLKLSCCLWIPVFLLDGASVFGTLALSADFATANAVSHAAVLTYTAFCLFFLCLWGAGAVGGAAMVYLRIAVLLGVIVLAVQLPNMHPRWLTPILGAGWPVLFPCVLRLGGLFSLSAALPLALGPDADPHGWLPLVSTAASGFLAVAISIFYTMMTPALISAPVVQGFRLDTVLSNGRSPLALQFPISLIWFGGLFLTLGFESVICVRSVSCLFPRIKPACICGAVCLILLLLSYLGLSESIRGLEGWYFLPLCLPLLAWLIVQFRRRRKVKA